MCPALCHCFSPGIISLQEEKGLPQDHAGDRKQSWDMNSDLPDSGALHIMSCEQSPPPFLLTLTPPPFSLACSLCWSPFLISVAVQMEESRAGWDRGNHPDFNFDPNPLLIVCGLC